MRDPRERRLNVKTSVLHDGSGVIVERIRHVRRQSQGRRRIALGAQIVGKQNPDLIHRCGKQFCFWTHAARSPLDIRYRLAEAASATVPLAPAHSPCEVPSHRWYGRVPSRSEGD